MPPRWFLTIDGEYVQIVSDDLPVVPVHLGGTGLNYLGPTNTMPIVGGASGLFWRKLTPDNIQPEYRSGTTRDGKYIIGLLTALAPDDGLKWDGTDWINVPFPAGGAHDLLDGDVNQDTLAAAVSRGSIIVGNSTPLWSELVLGGAGTIPRSDGSDLVYSTATYPNTVTANRLLYASATNVISDLASANSAVLVTDASGVPALSATMTDGQVIIGDTAGTPVAASITDDDDILLTAGAGTLDIRRVAQTGYWMIPTTWAEAVTTFAHPGANEVYALRFYLPCRLKVNSIHYRLNSNASANSVSVGLYDNAGTTKLIQSTVITTGIGTKSTTLGAEVDLSPGYYWAAFTASGTSATWQAVTGSGNFNIVMQAGTTHWILAGNASSSGTLPTTLGTLTANSLINNFPMIKLQN